MSIGYISWKVDKCFAVEQKKKRGETILFFLLLIIVDFCRNVHMHNNTYAAQLSIKNESPYKRRDFRCGNFSFQHRIGCLESCSLNAVLSWTRVRLHLNGLSWGVGDSRVWRNFSVQGAASSNGSDWLITKSKMIMIQPGSQYTSPCCLSSTAWATEDLWKCIHKTFASVLTKDQMSAPTLVAEVDFFPAAIDADSL